MGCVKLGGIGARRKQPCSTVAARNTKITEARGGVITTPAPILASHRRPSKTGPRAYGACKAVDQSRYARATISSRRIEAARRIMFDFTVLAVFALGLLTCQSVPRAFALQSHNTVTVSTNSLSLAALASACPIVRPFATTCTVQQASSSTTSEAKMAGLEAKLTRELLRDVRDFWFEHCSGEEGIILPGQEENKRCQRYAPTLEAIRASGITSGAELLAVAQPQTPAEWLALVLLLDQITRNSYRGKASAVVFNFFDPIARDVACAAIKNGIADAPEVRWRLGYRGWFYMPLMHSEDLVTHDLAVEQYNGIVKDVDSLLEPDADTTGWDEYRQRAAAVIRKRAEEAKKVTGVGVDFERRHRAIVERFGRYPHRNDALGRKHTPEEEDYLKNGGETF
ncbi:hypothetical protein HJFPF1_02634 [Paramyrothecium foliicola]|nr:hypothetical protein HJFPF1_02634 [Paramyrothecium foliicola]